MRNDYTYDEALDDLINFFKKNIKHDKELKNMLMSLEHYREQKTVAVRSIFEKYMQYVKKYNDTTPYTPEEKKMWDDLFYFWQ